MHQERIEHDNGTSIVKLMTKRLLSIMSNFCVLVFWGMVGRENYGILKLILIISNLSNYGQTILVTGFKMIVPRSEPKFKEF
jgi:hypothetical protein